MNHYINHYHNWIYMRQISYLKFGGLNTNHAKSKSEGIPEKAEEVGRKTADENGLCSRKRVSTKEVTRSLLS